MKTIYFESPWNTWYGDDIELALLLRNGEVVEHAFNVRHYSHEYTDPTNMWIDGEGYWYQYGTEDVDMVGFMPARQYRDMTNAANRCGEEVRFCVREY